MSCKYCGSAWACGRRVAWGAADHAPLAPALAWAQAALLGDAPWAQRVVPALAGALVVWLTGSAAARLGGGRAAVLLAAGAAAIAPVFLYASGVFGTSGLDQLAGAAAGVLLLDITARRRARRAWLALGLVVGLGFLAKYTILLAALGVGAGILATPARAQLGTRWPWLGAALAAALAAPNLVWQAAHGWPALAFIASSNAAVRARVPLWTVLADQPRLVHPFGLALAVAGVVVGVRGRGPARAAAVALLAVLAATLAVHGKAYYAAPAYPAAIAVGAVACARWARPWLAALWIAGGAVGLAGTLPLLPAGLGLERANPELTQFADWADVARQLARLAPGRAVLTDSYGTAAAVERYGPALGLPPPWSGANSYFAWGAARAGRAPDELLVVGYTPDEVAGLCRSLLPIGRVVGARAADNRFDFPRTARLCRVAGPDALARVWPSLRRFD